MSATPTDAQIAAAIRARCDIFRECPDIVLREITKTVRGLADGKTPGALAVDLGYRTQAPRRPHESGMARQWVASTLARLGFGESAVDVRSRGWEYAIESAEAIMREAEHL